MKNLFILFLTAFLVSCSQSNSSNNEFIGKWIRLNPKMKTKGKVINEYLTISDNGGNVTLSKTSDYRISTKESPILFTSIFEPKTNTLLLSQGPMSVRFSVVKESGILEAGFLGQYKRME